MDVIDIHHHFEPSGTNADGAPWAIGMALEQMDACGIATAVGYGGPVFGVDGAGRSEARSINEFCAAQVAAHPGRFRFFASLPLLDVEGALSEVTFAFDVLHAAGIGLAPQYYGAWLGDVRFVPVLAELDRRGAIVYVHPSGAGCTPAAQIGDGGTISAPWLEFPADTARAILSLWVSGATRRFPNIRFVFTHGGGIMPILLGRIAGFSGWRPVGAERLAELFPDGVYSAFASLWFDCAQAYAPETFALLRSIVPLDRLLYGSDFSYFDIAHSRARVDALPLSPAERALVMGANAATLLGS